MVPRYGHSIPQVLVTTWIIALLYIDVIYALHLSILTTTHEIALCNWYVTLSVLHVMVNIPIIACLATTVITTSMRLYAVGIFPQIVRIGVGVTIVYGNHACDTASWTRYVKVSTGVSSIVLIAGSVIAFVDTVSYARRLDRTTSTLRRTDTCEALLRTNTYFPEHLPDHLRDVYNSNDDTEPSVFTGV